MHEAIDEVRRRYRTYTWQPVRLGLSSATVWHLIGPRDLYVKIDRADLSGDAQRCAWLCSSGLPAPEVVEVGHDGSASWLVTTAVPGVPASAPWSVADRNQVVDSIAAITRRLHAVPVDSCPFDRRLERTLTDARAAADDGVVDLDDLDDERRGRTAVELLDELNATVPTVEDVVVCHNDLCLPNVIIDPATLQVTGLIDIGRLGIADRYADLALMCRSLSTEDLNPQFGAEYAERFLTQYGEHAPDRDRLDFYRLLDEFF